MLSGSDCIIAQNQEDFAETEQYLISQILHENAQLICLVRDAIESKETQRVLLVRRGDEVRGAAWIDEARESPDWDFVAFIEAEDEAAVESILDSLPMNATGYFRLHRRTVQEHFRNLSGAHPGRIEACYAVTSLMFRGVCGDEVIEITRNDAHMFHGCDSWAGHALDQIGVADRRIFAILKDGKVAASAILGPALINPDRESSVAGIASLYTEEQYRRMGLGKRLVSYMTELALQDNKHVHYWTTPDNTASQAVAESLGYWQYGTVVDYIWRTQCIQSTP